MTNVVDAIRKLMALVQSSNVNEAAAAARKAQRLMDEHNLTAVDVEREVDLRGCANAEVSGGATTLWKRTLIGGVAEINGCTTFRSGRSLIILGRPCDREVVVYLSVYLIREVERIGAADYTAMYMGRRRSLKRRRRWMQSFGYRASEEILARMRNERIDGAMALARQSEAANTEWLREVGVELGDGGAFDSLGWDGQSVRAAGRCSDSVARRRTWREAGGGGEMTAADLGLPETAQERAERFARAARAIKDSDLLGADFDDWVRRTCTELLEGYEAECPHCETAVHDGPCVAEAVQ